MRRLFATLGLPEVIVSDNATTFTSEEFRQFLKKNEIRHVLTPPYPASNGLAERAVQTFKEGMKKLREEETQRRRISGDEACPILVEILYHTTEQH